MVNIRLYEEQDFEEVVKMYHALLVEVYPHHKVKPILHCYQNVLNWIKWNYDIIITHNEKEITGFSLCYVDSMGGVVEDYYQGECIYIKHKYRKGRSAFMMYSYITAYADNMGYIISTNASMLTESHKIAGKLGEPIFTNYQRIPNA